MICVIGRRTLRAKPCSMWEWASLRSQALIIKSCIAGEGAVIAEQEVRRHVYDSGMLLMAALREGRSEGHNWFEPCFAYDNARLPKP